MPKKHLKRLNTPKTWRLSRENKYITRPNPGSHSFQNGFSLVYLLRDKMKIVNNAREAKYLLNTSEVLIDGQRRKDLKFIVGLMDTISIPSLKKVYRLTYDLKGHLSPLEINENESKLKICKITGKTSNGKKIQLNLFDGKNILVEKGEYKVGDSLLITLPENKIKETIKMENGIIVMIVGGKYAGTVTKIKNMQDGTLTFSTKGRDFQTAKKYAFALGKDKSSITVQ